jgi:hypothetical protein
MKDVKYPILAVINNGVESTWLDSFISIRTIKLPEDRFELGAMKATLEHTDWDEFILIQDTFEVINPEIFDILFTNYPDQSVFYGPSRQMFLAKYRRQVLEKLEIPDTRTKLESIFQESKFANLYESVEPFMIFNHSFRDENFYGNTEWKWGRENLVLKDEYLIKWKGTWDLEKQKPQDPQEFLKWNGGS